MRRRLWWLVAAVVAGQSAALAVEKEAARVAAGIDGGYNNRGSSVSATVATRVAATGGCGCDRAAEKQR